MYWSLLLSPWLWPVAFHGVSPKSFEAFRRNGGSTRTLESREDRPAISNNDLLDQLNASFCALLTLGVPTLAEELPIRPA
jgi:hypothetical protein